MNGVMGKGVKEKKNQNIKRKVTRILLVEMNELGLELGFT